MKIYINEIPGRLSKEVFFVQEPGQNFGSVGSYLTIGKNKEIVSTQIVREDRGSGNYIKPFMIIDDMTLADLVTAFVEYAKRHQIGQESESSAKGKLEAMKAHLEDMRTLVFHPDQHLIINKEDHDGL